MLFGSALSAGAASHGPDLRGVGLIDLGLAGGCTGTLIEPDLVLTAGHCLLSRIEGVRMKPEQFVFHPTSASGEPGPGFVAKLKVVHPVFAMPGVPEQNKIARDLGLLQLAEPVPAELATPITTTRPDDSQISGFVISFRGRGGGPARQRACPKIQRGGGVVELGCQVRRGESGSPYLVWSDGVLRMVAVVTAKWQNKSQPTALAVELSASFSGLMEAYRAVKK
ncbi:MAG: serine protease [Paracoccaceae bacterium]